MRKLTLPLSEADARSLTAGEIVTLDGEIVITAGLPTHQRILDYLAEGRPLPIDLNGGTLFHLGSYSRDTDGTFEVLYMNPTTSTRFNHMMPAVIRGLSLRAVGGKGGLSAPSTEAMKEVGCVYLSFLGGGSPLLSDAIKEVVSVSWDDFIAHYRLVKLRVENLGPLVVAIDAHGTNTYECLSEAAAARLPDIMRELNETRANPGG